MDEWYSTKQKDVISKLALMSDDDIDINAKENIKDRFTNILRDLKESDNALSEEIEEAQEILTRQIRPIYIYVALFSLIILFFGGQESVHQTFPIDGMNSMLYFSRILYLFQL